MTELAEAFLLAHGAYGAFEGDPGDSVVFGTYRRTGAWSPQLVSLIAERLFAGGPGTLLDVGANIGLIAIPVLERCRARCLAFEPEPTNLRLLQRNVHRHGFEARVEIHGVALDAEPGRTMLALSEENSGDHRLMRPHCAAAHGCACVEVAAARLDDVLEARKLEPPVVMKVDCQGAEARVLRGARASLARVDHLVIEYWPAGLLHMGDSAQALQQLLLCFPYAALHGFHALDQRLPSTESVFAQLAWIPTDGSDDGFFDLLLSRHERLAPQR